MIKLKIVALALISTVLLSAKGGCNEESSQQPVVGEWVWVKTFCCGRTSVWTTPENSTITKQLNIKSDGTFEYTSTGEPQLEGTANTGKYQLRKGLNDYQFQQGDSALTIQFNDQQPAYVEFIGDTLLLSRGYMDYDNVYYVRKSSK
ncbi:MAG: hypothetical protein K9I48_01555 [Sphingobacteriales bacterium]|jgi:hypothetical protein|nr:hypothetical protein [Sphingobacteriales bacterium]